MIILHAVNAVNAVAPRPGPDDRRRLPAAAMAPGIARRTPGGGRPGVILLLVLGMLSLFMVLGVAFVVMAARTRTAARAAAADPEATLRAILPTERLLDQAAMLLIRGPQTLDPDRQPAALGRAEEDDATDPDPDRALVFESLLEDQYGTDEPLRGHVVEIDDAGPVRRLTVAFDPPADHPPAALSGRVLSVLPVGAPATSHRILRAETAGKAHLRLCVARGTLRGVHATDTGADGLPSRGTKVVVNARAHGSSGAGRNEPWDGFDAANPFLAHVEPDPARPSGQIVIRPSMFKVESAEALRDLDRDNDDLDDDGVDDRADNDNDGVFDGWFFDPALPAIASPRTGLPVRIHVSCLIVDLDGRLNVNAHGSVNDVLRWADTVPFGSGYGPAEVDGGAVFRALAAASDNRCPDDPWMNVMFGARAGSTLYTAAGPRPGDRLMPLRFPEGTAIEGRYGWQANASATPLRGVSDRGALADAVPLPGHNGLADPAAGDGIRQLVGVAPARRGWAVDLHGRLQRRATRDAGPVPSLVYRKADDGDEFLDQPYELRLEGSTRRTGLHDPATGGTAPSVVADNPFAPAELERILRPYDPDAPALPERLAALLGSQAEASRLVVTTDSWDTAGVVGEAARRIYAWFSAVPPEVLHEHAASERAWDEMVAGTRCPNNLLPTEFAAGVRMDVARPVEGMLQRRLFFKDLYMAAVALSAPAGENPSADVAGRCAQWAANVIEYQDADSTMTRFEYDPRPLDGWDVDGDPATVETERETVWGAERPDVVVTQSLAWDDGADGELFLVLHHPWDGRYGDGPPGSAEPVAAELAGPAGPASVDMGKRTPQGDPIWRVRCGATFGFPGRDTCLDANEWMFLRPERPSPKGIDVPAAGATRHVVSIPEFRARLAIGGGSRPLNPRSTFVYLERLADPRAAHDAISNPYLIVDASAVFVADRSREDDEAIDPEVRFTSCRRNSGWAQQHDQLQWERGQTPTMTTDWEGDPRWFCWPNRPLVSPAELVFVPGFISGRVHDETHEGGVGMLADHVADPDDGVYLPDVVPGDELVALDAFTVPSRFAGTRHSLDRTAPYWEILTGLRLGFYGDRTADYRAPFEHAEVSAGREPGRVNLNTISSDAVWEAVIQGTVPRSAGADPDRPPYGLVKARTSGPELSGARFAELVSTGSAGTLFPAKTTGQLLGLSGIYDRPTLVLNDAAAIADAPLNPAHAYFTAMRLGNVATNRSHVFGIWITLRTMETTVGGGVDRDTVALHRLFLLFDRSRPLAFERGRDHNVRDGIVLRRVLQ